MLLASDLQEQFLISGKKMEVPLLRSSFVELNQPKLLPGTTVQRSRPQSFAQKLRSTGKSVKGYINLSEGVITPSFGASPSGSNLDKCTDVTCKDQGAHLTPRCWKTIYYLLDLYATRPETKTITHRFSIPADAAEHSKSGRKYEILNETKDIDIEKGLNAENSSTPVPPSRELSEC